MTFDRRMVLASAAGLFALPLAAQAGGAKPAGMPAGLTADPEVDQTAALQAQIDAAAARKVVLDLPPGVFKTRSLMLRPGSALSGAGALTTLAFEGSGALFTANGCERVTLTGFAADGQNRKPGEAQALMSFSQCSGLELSGLIVSNAAANAIAISGSSGRVTGLQITGVQKAALFCLDSVMLISGNTISMCGNNGILVWRSALAEDGSQVVNNHIFKIRTDDGGTGQNGNGINVYRAGSVIVAGNRITDCAYSAIRGNAANNISMTGNSCQRIGEVALYAEFGFQGAVIANNIVDTAACGVSVTNFNEGGRLAVVQGNLIRNLMRREFEPEDKRGEGIAVEADTLVTGNTIENAPTCGILLGWGHYMRDVSATGNIVRGCKTGILVSADPGAGMAMVTGNLISGATDGAIRAHDKGKPFGADLAKAAPTTGRVTISGNSAG